MRKSTRRLSEYEVDDVEDWYNNQLARRGWQRWKNTQHTWLKSFDQTVFTLNLQVYSDPTQIDSFQAFYHLPEHTLQQAGRYSTAYLLSISAMFDFVRAKCLGE